MRELQVVLVYGRIYVSVFYFVTENMPAHTVQCTTVVHALCAALKENEKKNCMFLQADLNPDHHINMRMGSQLRYIR